MVPMCRLMVLVATLTTPFAAIATYQPINSDGFGSHIEGASVYMGSIYATHFRNTSDGSTAGNNDNRNVIGRVDIETGMTRAFFVGDGNSVFNGMKWDPSSNSLFLADVGRGRVVRLDLETMDFEDYCGSDGSLEGTGAPNDLVLTFGGASRNIYLSGQNWVESSGGLWLCKSDGSIEQLESMNRTNGIALSPDDEYLYLTEAVGSPVSEPDLPYGQRIWRYSLAANGSVGNKTEFFNFANLPVPMADVDTDGMRTDVQGNLYATRNGAASVSVIGPNGTFSMDIALRNTTYPTNLAFGGDDGMTLYVVGRCGNAGWSMGDGCIEAHRVAFAGREWALLQEASLMPVQIDDIDSTTLEEDKEDGNSSTSIGMVEVATITGLELREGMALSFKPVGMGGELEIEFTVQLNSMAWLGIGISYGDQVSMSGNGQGADIVVCSDGVVTRHWVTARMINEANGQELPNATCVQENGATTLVFRRTVRAQRMQERAIMPGIMQQMIFAYGADGEAGLAYHGGQKGGTFIDFGEAAMEGDSDTSGSSGERHLHGVFYFSLFGLFLFTCLSSR